MAQAPTTRKLGLTRDQLASFLQDHEQIKQFENLFNTVDEEVSGGAVTDASTLAQNAYAIGNEAMAGIVALNNLVAPLVTAPPPTGGTVTSVGASGGTTGLTFSGSPITTSGTFVLGGTLVVANGGTGATNATDARINLSAAKSGANSDITSLSGITGSISTVDSITFDLTAGITVGQGQIAWNSGDGTLYLGMGYDAVVQHVGLDQYFRIKASAAITKGQCVMFTGAVGSSGVLTGAPATGVTNPQYIMGVATMDIANNGFGYITSFGTVRGINTTGAPVGETWVDGDILYYNPAYTGGLTKVEPIAPLPKVVVAAVTNAGSGGSGSLSVRIQAEPYLRGLTDVYAPSPIANGQILIGDGPQSRWEAATLTAGTNVSITNAAGAITINATDQYVGTVTSVSGTGTVNGITLTGTVTSSGSLTLGGTLSGVSLTSQVTGTLPVANGGTGVTTSTGSGSTVLSSQPSFGSTIGVGGASASASGAGVSFPASQSASTDPNTLDDYEEGSCTITIQDSAGNSATMGGGNVFRYVKVGAFVQVSGTLNWTSTAALSAGSRLQFHGLPFVVNNVGNYRAPALFGSSAPGSFNITRAEIAGGADNGNTFIFGTRVSGNNVDGSMVPADIGSSGTMYGFQINYTTTF